MQQITIPGTTLRTSRFILGTANLFSLQSGTKSESFLERAAELGFTHFDTAPLYGFGFAERALAPVLRRHPQLTVTTKAGLYAPGGEDQGWTAILARKLVGQALPVVSRAIVDLAVSRARASLEASLKRLRRGRVELFLVHEPNVEIMAADEWLRWLSSEQSEGRIGAFGVAGTSERTARILSVAPSLATVIQMPDSLDGREADMLAAVGRPMQITYGYSRRRNTNQRVPEILAAALRRNKHGAIIVSTRRQERLTQYRDAEAADNNLKDMQ